MADHRDYSEGVAKVLNPREEIVWQGKPEFLPYVLDFVPIMLFGLVWTIASFYFIYLVLRYEYQFLALVSTPFLALVGLLMLIVYPGYKLLTYKYDWYTLTNQRVILQSGLFDYRFDLIEYGNIEAITATINFVDKIAREDTGNIHVYTFRLLEMEKLAIGQAPTHLSAVTFHLAHVKDPYTAFDFLKNASSTVKPDISYRIL